MEKELEFYSLFSAQKSKEAVLKSNFSSDFFDVFSDKVNFEIPVLTEIVLGKTMYDKIDFNDGINFVISEQFLKILTENKLTGWKTYPVIIKNTDKNYYGFQIIGKSGPLKEKKQKGFHIGYEFNKTSWDGNDFFTPEKTHLRFLSERAKEVLNCEKLTNIEIENIKTIENYSFGEE
ncbi:hypothetical protein [Bizionia arctica]|uniref:Uncharacterized protein n=1 Tax=Bizionia arctica TaxID=1495645 RepID=A0A917GII0_9FLAO|nr:hypothetical protein [Bizionia arctica]GGG46767.1 hypothetical protein GCM10010976_17760 [Bizionia arctica]